MTIAVITIAHRRSAHLRRQIDGIRCSSRLPEHHVVVAMDDPTVGDIVSDSGATATVVEIDGDGGPLPLAAARNAGADAAIDAGAELLVFLDVDCVPGRSLIDRYRQAAQSRDALLCGDVTYLPPPGPHGYPSRLDDLVDPHPARPAPADGDVVTTDDYHLFWSLSFASSAQTWRRIGGFCTRYRGYGAEDTDFGQVAAARGVPMCWVGGAHAFHQYHPVSDPPVEHLQDVVRNAEIFYDRWGWWPMPGWLNAFEERGLISRVDDGRPVVGSNQRG